MAAEPEALRDFANALNEPDPVLRMIMLQSCWAESATLQWGLRVAEGREGVCAFIGKQLDSDPHYTLRLLDTKKLGGARAWARCRVWRADGEPEDVVVLAAVSPEGLLTEAKIADAAQPSSESVRAWSRFGGWIVSNPSVVIALIGAGLFFALRVPLGIFYGDLGVAPEEVGFGPQELVAQGAVLLASLTVLMLFAALAMVMVAALRSAPEVIERLKRRGDTSNARLGGCLLYGLGISVSVPLWWWLITSVPPGWPDNLLISVVVGMGPLVIAGAVGFSLGRFALLRLPAAKRELQWVQSIRQRRLGSEDTAVATLVVVAFIAVYLFVAVTPFVAVEDADSVRRGGSAGGRLYPWRALPAEVIWQRGAAQPVLTNDCSVLRYLGANGRTMALFDTQRDRVFRVPLDHASVSVARACLESATADTYLEKSRGGFTGVFLLVACPATDCNISVTGYVEIEGRRRGAHRRDQLARVTARARKGQPELVSANFSRPTRSRIEQSLREKRSARVHTEVLLVDSEQNTRKIKRDVTLFAD